MNKKSLKEYRIWRAMKARCYAPSSTKGNYKKNNITVCDRWLHSFDNFIEDMGWMPDYSYSIERIDVRKGYQPDNCIWIPQKEQSKNRCNSHMYNVNGRAMCLKDVARMIGVKYTTLYCGLFRYGKTIKDYAPSGVIITKL